MDTSRNSSARVSASPNHGTVREYRTNATLQPFAPIVRLLRSNVAAAAQTSHTVKEHGDVNTGESILEKAENRRQRQQLAIDDEDRQAREQHPSISLSEPKQFHSEVPMSLPRVDTARVDVDLENINDKERYDNQGFLFSNSPEDKYGSTTSSPRAVGEAPHAEQAGTEHRQPQDEDIEERHVTERRVQLSDGQHIDQSINRLKQVKRRHATATPSSSKSTNRR